MLLALLGLIPTLAPLFLGFLQKKVDAGTESEKTIASALIAQMNARRDIVVAEQGHWFTAMIRPLLAMPVVVYMWKTVVWDKVLGLGVTDPLGGDIQQWAYMIVAAYFVSEGATQIARIIKS